MIGTMYVNIGIEWLPSTWSGWYLRHTEHPQIFIYELWRLWLIHSFFLYDAIVPKTILLLFPFKHITDRFRPTRPKSNFSTWTRRSLFDHLIALTLSLLFHCSSRSTCFSKLIVTSTARVISSPPCVILFFRVKYLFLLLFSKSHI